MIEENHIYLCLITNYLINTIFVCLFFKGSQANVIWQDQAKLGMEMVKDAFWDYVAKATETTEDILQKIKEYEMGQELKWAINHKYFHF